MKQKKLMIVVDSEILVAHNTAATHDSSISAASSAQYVLANNKWHYCYEHLNEPDAPGSQVFIRELIKRGHDVIVSINEAPSIALARANWVTANFALINPANIVAGKRKDVYTPDIMIGGTASSISGSKAQHTILMGSAQDVSGALSVRDFGECLHLIDIITRQSACVPHYAPTYVVCVTGPSIADVCEVVTAFKNAGYTIPRVFTTNPDASENYFRIISQEVFDDEDALLHYSAVMRNNGYSYGIRTEDMVRHMSGRSAKSLKLVMPMDIYGANNLYRIYGECVKTVYVKPERSKLVARILQESISEEEKVRKIIALDAEPQKEALCDVIVVADTIDDIVQQIKAL